MKKYSEQKVNKVNKVNLEDSHNQIFKYFTKSFMQVYRHMEVDKRKKLLDFAPFLFQKWYASTLVEETILSPGYMIAADKRLGLKEDETACYQLIVDKNAQNQTQFHYHLLYYTINNHPIIADIKEILLYCQPDIRTEEDGELLPEDAAALLEKLSRKDMFYQKYLLKLCWSMDFLVTLPSIYSMKIQSANFEPFLELSPKEQLQKLLTAAIELASQQIKQGMYLDLDFIPDDFLKSYLESAQDVDKIFAAIFHMLNIDIENIWETSSDDFFNLDGDSIISSFYYIGVLLDKWFITPMSFYFCVISPYHFVPFTFVNSINNLTSLLIMDNDVSMELYSPCSHFQQTGLGRALLGTTDDIQTLYKIPINMTFEQLVAGVQIDERMQKDLAKRGMHEQGKRVYTFKAKHTSYKQKWKVIEVYAHSQLDAFCKDLCTAFCLDNVLDYTLTVWDENKFPVDFSLPDSKRSVNKMYTQTLDSLCLATGDKMLFTPIPNKDQQLELTLMKTTASNPFIIYPRIKKQSLKITQAEKMEDLF